LRLLYQIYANLVKIKQHIINIALEIKTRKEILYIIADKNRINSLNYYNKFTI